MTAGEALHNDRTVGVRGAASPELGGEHFDMDPISEPESLAPRSGAVPARGAERLTEDDYRAIIEHAPVGMVLEDRNCVLLSNQALCNLLGYVEPDELRACSELLLGHIHPADRAAVQRWRTDSGRGQRAASRQRYRLISKRGETLWIEEICRSVPLPHGLVQLRILLDLTERGQIEHAAFGQFRLDLWECAATEPLDVLMRRALDEICSITASPIGFYHFVEEDQKTLSLQAWSSRTVAEFCTAQGAGMHYSIDQAGVWVDAFHQRKAVIHNDYASLPHRKGLPEGHAPVVRQLVVPVLRDGKVVSILGVGNKAIDYDEEDVKLVSTVADLVWAIVAHKRTQERIRELNAKLETLAMTDDLTGVLNRRSFFERGREQINHFARYQTAFSLLSLDIDGFKQINDTHGHDAGDLALQSFANTIRDNIRNTDIFARLGGEEFCIILPNTSKGSAVAAAEKLRHAIESSPCNIDAHRTIDMTVSIGVATVDAGLQSFDAVMKCADTALYQAKHEGRNRVVPHREP